MSLPADAQSIRPLAYHTVLTTCAPDPKPYLSGISLSGGRKTTWRSKIWLAWILRILLCSSVEDFANLAYLVPIFPNSPPSSAAAAVLKSLTAAILCQRPSPRSDKARVLRRLRLQGWL